MSMIAFGEIIVVALAVVAAVGGLVAVLYFLWLVLLDVRQNVGDRASAPPSHVLHYAKR
jgi:hypothetical protein